MASSGHDPVYLVIPALGIGLGLSVGFATDAVLWGLIGGAIAGAVGCVAYFFIRRAVAPKTPKRIKSRYRM